MDLANDSAELGRIGHNHIIRLLFIAQAMALGNNGTNSNLIGGIENGRREQGC